MCLLAVKVKKGETEHEQREKEIEIGRFWETNCLFYSGVFYLPFSYLFRMTVMVKGSRGVRWRASVWEEGTSKGGVDMMVMKQVW